MNTTYTRSIGLRYVFILTVVGLTACKTSSLLGVPGATNIVTGNAINSPLAAEQVFLSARSNFFAALVGYNNGPLINYAGLLSDEMTAGLYWMNIDARYTAAAVGNIVPYGDGEPGDQPLENLLVARSALLLVTSPLAQYAPGDTVSQVGEAEALAGYAEVFMAEDYCAGVPLTQDFAGGGFVFGTPLTTDSLLGAAEAHFKLALAAAHQNDTVINLASVGLGRAYMDRGRYDSAASAAAQVPANFVYNIVGETNGNQQYAATFYDFTVPGAEAQNWNFCGSVRCSALFNVSDREGGNGLNFVSANDPRLVLNPNLSVTGLSVKAPGYPDSVFYYPMKFGYPTAADVPLATGIEAQLMVAEAALVADNNPGTWLTTLNNLRNTGCSVTGSDTICNLGTGVVPAQVAGLPNLQDPGTVAGEIALTFRERAFWLYGTGTRLGDMRRLIRQYGAANNFTADNVYPTGAYAPANNVIVSAALSGYGYSLSPIQQYGKDVSLTLPTQASGTVTSNPNYKGCIVPTTTA